MIALRRSLLLPLAFLLIIPATARAQAAPVFHADFEQLGDTVSRVFPVKHAPAGADVHVDDVSPHGGRFSLRVSQPTAGERAVLVGEFPLTRPTMAGALRLSGWIRTENVHGDASLGVVALAPAYTALRSLPSYARTKERTTEFMSGKGSDSGQATGTSAWRRYEATIPVLAGATRLQVFIRVDGTGTAWFDDFTVMPIGTGAFRASSAGARAYVSEALDTMQAHVLNGHLVEWASFRAAVLGLLDGAVTTADTYPAIMVALKALNPHSFLATPARQKSMTTPDSTVASALQYPADTILGRVGYLRLPGFTSLAGSQMNRYAERGQEALMRQDAAGVCGYVLDLRGNTGGNAFPMLGAIAPLLPSKLDVQARYHDGRLSVHDTVLVTVRNPARAHPDAPVAVLMGVHTASSGEAVLLAFVGRPQARTFGQPSEGMTTGNHGYPLSDGAWLYVTRGRMADRAGRKYGGPVVPDVPVAASEASTLAEDPVVHAATTWLMGRRSCRGRASRIMQAAGRRDNDGNGRP